MADKTLKHGRPEDGPRWRDPLGTNPLATVDLLIGQVDELIRRNPRFLTETAEVMKMRLLTLKTALEGPG